ncbi:uncharacterized protein TRIVIDRAFT_223103 [Trichoderma virens Gv29-8]|uniref:Uncharacterized protein n=1 Tax=Hypocrea virens (strain Gv29-8 / FGSC 10586) TaxID=413071 RepID=G9MW35_HYPVG|nr:uncharacterized protein TRIVIDRAFT_223103 [Trichoderma virens Gv29-8]EHK21331.1 hypothetical protein TRIVIDRAFT_223103 [Trichoderma virens Gv29-8]UKZ47129.1 hypothetical protein TrVGV298_001343 [Trichoderma virens]
MHSSEDTSVEVSTPSGNALSAMDTIKAMFSPAITRNQPNPVYVEMAARCYHIQSRVLHIPDRFGYFLPGPPRLAAQDAFAFALIFFTFGLPLAAFAICWVVFKSVRQEILLGTIGYLVMCFMLLVLLWAVEIHRYRRMRGHDGEDVELKVLLE